MKISIEEAISLLKNGEVVAVPTETVYGLAASLEFPWAVDKIFSLKGRPSNNPLIVHLGSSLQILDYVTSLPKGFDELAKAFWPGPLTLVVPVIEEKISDRIRAGLKTCAFRVPSHLSARNILLKSGPLVMPSANLSGSPSSTTFQHVEDDFGTLFPVVDGGKCEGGIESTILYYDDLKEDSLGLENQTVWKIIRQGALPASSFEAILGYIPEIVTIDKESKTPLCPGQLFRHYAPRARLHLVNSFPSHLNSPVVGFEDRSYPEDCKVYSIGKSLLPEETASKLYSVLRELDNDGVQEAYVDINFPDYGLWKTVKERLTKAAHG